MCGRMTLTRSGSEIAEHFALAMAESGGASEAAIEGWDAVTEEGGAALRPRYNIAPSQSVPTILQGVDGTAMLDWKTWGLVPSWSKDAAAGGRLFNARSETADTKPSFRSAWKRRRCLIVADGFYEWTPRNRDHQPYHFWQPNGTLLALAGLFEQWQGEGGEVIDSCTVLTTEANADLEGVHHRMPVILDPGAFAVWLNPASESSLLKGLTVPAPKGTLERRAVSRRVNSPRFDDAECLLGEEFDAPRDSGSSPEKKSIDSTEEVEQGELFRRDEEGGE
jgi:putative SOS response-associated peptidase YedK